MDEDHLREQIINIKIPLSNDNLREELNFYKELKSFFREYDKPTEDLDFIINNIESGLEIFNTVGNITLDEQKIIEQIEKHPYFKNPCDYAIRLITILKYLKVKGFNMNYQDIDIYVEKLILRIDGVKKVDRGKFMKSKQK